MAKGGSDAARLAVEDVFTTTALPSRFTYVRRELLDDNGQPYTLEHRIEEGLRNSSIVLLLGPSKTGKSWLWGQSVRHSHRIPIECDCRPTWTSDQVVWEELARNAGLRQAPVVEVGGGSKVNAGGSVVGVEVNAEIRQSWEPVGAPVSPRWLAEKLGSRAVVVLEEAHLLRSDVRPLVIQGLKTLSDQGVPSVVVGVFHSADDVLRLVRDASGRCEAISCVLWSVGDLRLIAAKGLRQCKVVVDEGRASETLETIARRSCGFPFMTQSICRKLLHDDGIAAIGSERRVDWPERTVTRAAEAVLRTRSAEFAPRVEAFSRGPDGTLPANQQWYAMLVRAVVARRANSLELRELVRTMAQVAEEGERAPAEDEHEFRAMLEGLAAFQRGLSLLWFEWIDTTSTLNVIEPEIHLVLSVEPAGSSRGGMLARLRGYLLGS